jgi:cell division protein FtsB
MCIMSKTSTQQQSSDSKSSSRRTFRQRPLLSFPQILVLVAIVVAIYIGVDLNHRAQTGRLIQANELSLEEEVALESTRQIELMVTREYVNSDDYVAASARNEAGMILPGEKRIVPLRLDNSPLPTVVPTATPDPAYDARAWQAWWRLFSDAPLPSR